MEWNSCYNHDKEPTFNEISDFINNTLWQDINSFIQKYYGIEPKKEYSNCSLQRGWNMKYKVGGKSLCTLYPMCGYFIALIVIGKKEIENVESQLVTFSTYTQELYNKTNFYNGGKWLILDITNQDTLNDMKTFIQIRVKPKLQFNDYN